VVPMAHPRALSCSRREATPELAIGRSSKWHRRYEAQGDMYFEQERDRLIDDRHVALFADGDAVVITAGTEPQRFLLVSGKPIGEAIAWRGPIVMNTQRADPAALSRRQGATHGEAVHVARASLDDDVDKGRVRRGHGGLVREERAPREANDRT
jgi:pirin-like protein